MQKEGEMSEKQVLLLKKWAPVLERCRDVDPVFHIAMAQEFDEAMTDAQDAARISLQEAGCMGVASRQIGRIRDKYKEIAFLEKIKKIKPPPRVEEPGARKLIL